MIPPLEYFLEAPKGRCIESHIRKNFPELYNIIKNFPGSKFSEKLYRYFYGEPKPCPICGGCTKFKSFLEGFSRTCSLKSAYADNERTNKIKKTKEIRYGNSAYNNREKFKETISGQDIGFASESFKKTMMEKYGVANPGECKELREKVMQTNLERYGVECVLVREDVREKSRKVLEEKYGGSYLGTEEFKRSRYIWEPERIKKTISTLISRYGVEHYSKTDEFKNLLKEYSVIRNLNNYPEIISIENGLWRCKCPHDKCKKCQEKYFETPYHIFFDRKMLGSELCTRLLPIGKSNSGTTIEIFIRDFLDEYNIEYKTNVRDIIPPKELDIYIPSKSIAIECNGIYWHSLKEPKYHQNKFLECQSKGVQLIQIWEDWVINKPEIVKSILLNKLGLTPNKIYGRCCTIREVSAKDATKFLDENHIQGSTPSSVKLGLYYKDQLVSLMTFTKNKNCWVLSRFCNILYTNIIGGASKLLKEFMRKFSGNIISYSSNDISTGNLYKVLGFTKTNVSVAYWYISQENFKRFHRSSFMKSKIKAPGDPEATEFEIMSKLPYWRIYDSGTTTWILHRQGDQDYQQD